MLRPKNLLPSLCLLSALFSTTSACVPTFLHKYQAEKQRREVDSASNPSSGTRRQAIVALGEGTFRLALSYERVWDSLLDVLLRNYNLQIAERTSGLITTEWDSYYLEGKVHRNKVSVRMKRTMAGVELSIHNNVEILSRLPDGGVTEVWLPSDKNKPEIGRIVQNIAIAMGVPRPNLPQEMMAQGSPAVPAPAAEQQGTL